MTHPPSEPLTPPAKAAPFQRAVTDSHHLCVTLFATDAPFAGVTPPGWPPLQAPPACVTSPLRLSVLAVPPVRIAPSQLPVIDRHRYGTGLLRAHRRYISECTRKRGCYTRTHRGE